MTRFVALSFVAAAIGFAADDSVTFHKDVEPILQKNCQSCHRPGEAAPFSMLTYQSTRPWAKSMKTAVASRRMPPWHADPSVGHFRNDRRLSDADIATISGWVDAGAPEGNAQDAPPPLKFIEGWNIGKPDWVIEMPNAFEVPSKGTVDYQWIVLPTGFKEDRWIQAVEVRPGDRSVVHHVIAFYRKPGSKWLSDAAPGVATSKGSGDPESGMSDGSIGGYVPGLPPSGFPEGRAILLPAGSDIVLQMHYTTSGKAALDKTKVGVIFAKEPPKERSVSLTVGLAKFTIPPGVPDHALDASFTIDSDLRLVNFTPHMHLRGKSFEYRATLPDGTKEVLLRVPKYDFNWQVTYELATERVFPAGTRFEATAVFDNSPNNPFNPDPKAEVHFGDQTWDEMFVGFMAFAVPKDFDTRKMIRRPPPAQPRATEALQ